MNPLLSPNEFVRHLWTFREELVLMIISVVMLVVQIWFVAII